MKKVSTETRKILMPDKNRKGGHLDKYTDQNLYIVKDILVNGNIRIQNTQTQQITSTPPSHLKRYRHPKDTSPYQDSKENKQSDWSESSNNSPIHSPHDKKSSQKTYSKIEKSTSNSVKSKLVECDESNGVQVEDISYNNSILPDIKNAQEICELDTKELQKIH